MPRKHALLALTLTAGLTLTGCSAIDDRLPDKVAGVTTASPTPTPIAGDLDGNGQLSEREKEIAAKSAPRTFTMPDGTVLIIDPAQPLPQPVVDLITAEAAPLATAATQSAMADDKSKVINGLRDIARARAEDTGRQVVFTYPSLGAASGGGTETVWASIHSGGEGYTGMTQRSRDEAIATMTEWADKRNAQLIVLG